LGFVALCLGCSAVAGDTEQKGIGRFTGSIMVFVADNFKDGISQKGYALSIDGSKGMVSLRFADQGPPTDLRSGMQVEVRGRKQKGYIDVQSLQVLAEPR